MVKESPFSTSAVSRLLFTGWLVGALHCNWLVLLTRKKFFKFLRHQGDLCTTSRIKGEVGLMRHNWSPVYCHGRWWCRRRSDGTRWLINAACSVFCCQVLSFIIIILLFLFPDKSPFCSRDAQALSIIGAQQQQEPLDAFRMRIMMCRTKQRMHLLWLSCVQYLVQTIIR